MCPPTIDGSDAVVDAILDFMDESFPGERFALVGNSWGGMLARSIASRHDSRTIGLALICPTVVADQQRRTLPPRTVIHNDSELLSSLPEQDRTDYAAMSVIQTPENWRLFRDHVIPGLRTFDEGAGEQIGRGYALENDPESTGRAYQKPTLIITGRQDQAVGYFDAFAVLENYPHATFVALDRAGHNAHLDQRALVDTLFAEWLARVDQASGLVGAHRDSATLLEPVEAPLGR